MTKRQREYRAEAVRLIGTLLGTCRPEVRKILQTAATRLDPSQLSDKEERWYRKEADQQYGREGEIEIDSDACISKGADDGAYVQAWVWVYAKER